MFTIIKQQVIDGLRDSLFLFIAVVVLLTFVVNGFVFSDRYHVAREDWERHNANTIEFLEARTSNLTVLARYYQTMVKPASTLTFIANGGEERLPNSYSVNAFLYVNPRLQNRGNETLPDFLIIDWIFIIGIVLSLQAFMLGFRAICGEKRDGTLRLLMSYSVSRWKLFFGKYVGYLTILLVTFALGASINLFILNVTGAMQFTSTTLFVLGWTAIVSVLFISFVLLFGIAVSSMVRTPAVALVILMIFWLFAVIAVPGIARIIGENAMQVPSESDVSQEINLARSEIWDNSKEGAGAWYGDNEYRFTQAARNRAEVYQAISASIQNIFNSADKQRIDQAVLINTIASLSPYGLMSDALQRLTRQGIYGYSDLKEAARRYQQQLYSFTKEKDRIDPDSPHNLYHGVERGGFSTKPVELSSIPRSDVLWQSGGLLGDLHVPWMHMVMLMASNVVMMLVAFIFLLRYDPR